MAQNMGFEVSGSDANLYPPMSLELQKRKIPYHEGYAATNLPSGATTIVLGNAISRGNVELEEVLNRRLAILSLPEFIARYVIASRKSLVIAGTHGKTTTTALVAHILREAGIDAGFMVGGVCENFSQSAEVGTADTFVIEGDEYDTSIFDPRSKFLSYKPTHAILNNIEFDHGDIFSDLDDVERAFARLVKILPSNGALVTNADNTLCMRLAEKSFARVVTFGESADADLRLTMLETRAQSIIHYRKNERDEKIISPLLGKHNALNTLAALALLETQGIDRATFQRALSSFKGVKRRLETRLMSPQYTIIEDFAHHPTAIQANILTLKEVYPTRRLVVLIEPRSNTLVRNIFQSELTHALSFADCVFVNAIYRAEKYKAEERLDTTLVVQTLNDRGTSAFLLPTERRLEFVVSKLQAHDVVCFMTNGSFGGLIDQTVQALRLPD